MALIRSVVYLDPFVAPIVIGFGFEVNANYEIAGRAGIDFLSVGLQ